MNEQQPIACIGTNGELMWLNKPRAIYSKPIPLYTNPPQPTQEPYGYVSDDKNMNFQKEKPQIGRWIQVYTAQPQRPLAALRIKNT